MRIFKNAKQRDITLIIGTTIFVIVGIVIVCVLLWPKEEKTPEIPKNSQSTQQQENNQSDGPLYTVVPCEELEKITGEPCQNNTETPTTPTYTPNYTAPTSDQPQTPTQYDVPSV